MCKVVGFPQHCKIQSKIKIVIGRKGREAEWAHLSCLPLYFTTLEHSSTQWLLSEKPYTNISTHDLCWGRVSQPPNGFPLGKTTDCIIQECKRPLPGENQTACFSTPQFCRTASQDLCTGRVRNKISSCHVLPPPS